ncbi:MAG: ATP-binding protein [Thermodesulfobacteriota bacterium]
MALRITILIVIATGVSYWHMQKTLRASFLRNLSDYTVLRGKAESEQFLLAELQTAMVRDEFLRRFQAMGDHDPQAEFDKIFARDDDGLIRVRAEINDHRHRATAYLRHDVPLTADLRRRMLIGWQLMDQWGPMLVNRFFSGFMNMPEQLSINFCPTADWGRSATRETDITIYETVWRATKEKNPQRSPFWTSVYYDPGAKAWMVSCVTPGDHEGRWVVTGGQDVEISDLIKRTAASPLAEGTWNFIVDHHSNLIAHPNLSEQIAKAGGNLRIDKLADPELLTMAQAVLADGTNRGPIIEPPGLDVILGVSRIDGPGWYFVTVLPRHLLSAQAASAARVFLLVGFATLLIELLIMAVILRRRITRPIAETVAATEQISRGDFSVRLDTQRQDELGLLAASVNRMAAAVGERDAILTHQYNELKEAKHIQQEQQKRECIGTLAGGIAHDFNNILAAIIGYTDLALTRKPGDEKWRNDLQEVHKASARAKALVRQILTFSRNQEQEKAPVQISLIVEEALKLLRASIPSTIEIRQQIQCQALVLADSTQIHQVLLNLCTNAYQAMQEQGGVLTVTLKEVTLEPALAQKYRLPAGHYVRLTVSDNGCGMDTATLSRIFDPYFTTKEQGKGTGLGLAVVHGIVEGHRGRITVQSEPGRGSTFTVHLPVIIHPSGGEGVTAPASFPGTAKGHGRVMVVDDEESLREMITQVLTQAGYQVDTFRHGLEAWEALERTPAGWDLLITDQTMPRMSGDQLTIKALALRPDLPVILCSGHSPSLKLDEIKKAGLFGYLEKPLDIQILLMLTGKAIRNGTPKSGPDEIGDG